MEQRKTAIAKSTALRTSPYKLNLVAEMIRGMKADKALTALTFSKRRIAVDVKKVLQSAIANAENNHGMNADRLVVSQAFVGKGLALKRRGMHAKGRGSTIVKMLSKLTIEVAQVDAEVKKAKKEGKEVKPKKAAKAAEKKKD